ncbi:MAG TPA: lanthionine synthetase LanC family protein, partial [Candidatus Deferrimicrobium sp.]|nr:lanthionine synthetase LanC family protein [Candidatus Deferrimicrobium sp.]
IYTDEDEITHREAYLKNNMEFFTTGGDMNAWCHGAAGIGLSRLRAHELFKDMNSQFHEMVLKEAMVAIEKTIATDIELENLRTLFILCHGSGGNTELFLQAYETFKDEKYLSLAEKVAQKALDSQKKFSKYLCGYRGDPGNEEEEDTSLFMGNAGIGYFYLRVLAPHDVPSILIPKIDAVTSQPYPLSLPEVGKKLLKKYFSRSIALIEKFHDRELTCFLNDTPLDISGKPLKHSFIDFMEKTIPGMSPREQNCISDAFILEREKIKMDEAIPGHSYLDIKDKVLRERAEKLVESDENAFLDLKLILEPTVQIATTEWDWSVDNEKEWPNNINLEPDIFPLLLKPMPQKILEEPLSPMSYTILGGFEGGNSVTNVRIQTIEAFETLTPEQEKMLTEKIIEQIKQALLAGILIPVL